VEYDLCRCRADPVPGIKTERQEQRGRSKKTRADN
jgi:hypothetical protein